MGQEHNNIRGEESSRRVEEVGSRGWCSRSDAASPHPVIESLIYANLCL